ncbi:nucleotidyltransferase domain-containing protein [Dehalobacter sp. DCM]|uniref:nucleotidyltransferase domain-containing protein n=1 Tax=Dehalobacter sp. DCM TaxID=2907827 RepID=UPI003081979A|nr:nucleotidyltransferase domain-containing protein [Dehalobacter sp. DCM]
MQTSVTLGTLWEIAEKGLIFMHDRILAELNNIEKQYHVRILYACESGSRAWGFPSKDSDYDVRFIYIHPAEWYLSVFDKRDVIEVPINDALDINGWDIRKALQLVRKSNPSMIEWFQSPIVYKQTTSVPEKIRSIITSNFSPKACLYHYLSMAKTNYREYLQGDLVRTKKYFYVLRPILACMWIEQYENIPPIEFGRLFDTLLSKSDLSREIEELLKRKIAGEEFDSEPRISVINEFIDLKIDHFESYISSLRSGVPREEQIFNTVFREALNEVWG